jgi:hypothetical protein
MVLPGMREKVGPESVIRGSGVREEESMRVEDPTGRIQVSRFSHSPFWSDPSERDGAAERCAAICHCVLERDNHLQIHDAIRIPSEFAAMSKDMRFRSRMTRRTFHVTGRL